MQEKKYWVTLALFPLLFFEALSKDSLAEINKDINLNRQKIEKTEKERSYIANMLQSLGNEINQKNQKIHELDIEVKSLEESISQNQAQNQAQEQSLYQYQKVFDSLKKDQDAIKGRILDILIRDLAFIMILNEKNPVSPEDIVLQEVFKFLSKQSQDKINVLAQQQVVIKMKIDQIQESMSVLNTSIDAQKNRKNRLQALVLEQKQLVANIQKDLQAYAQKMRQNEKERRSLDEILGRLNIVKQNKQRELENQARQKQIDEKEQLSKRSIGRSMEAQSAPINVKQVANSYKELSVVKYLGVRTIAPIERYDVEQAFGTYFDPVYRLKVFNEAVILTSKTSNAPVRSIFDGKVVYAKEVPILKKVVIIENQNGIHTIYSQLDKIAPTIRVGLRIKKGYVIGRIDQRLSFEITQEDKYINPLEVIASSR